MLVTNWLTHSVTFSRLDGCEWCQLPGDVVTVFWVGKWFWSWSSGKILKLEFVQHFLADVLQRLQSLVNILNFKFSRDGDVWLRFWSKSLVVILKMKFDQDLCLNLWYYPIAYFGKMNSTLGSVVPLAMFSFSFEHLCIFLLAMYFLLFTANIAAMH